MGRRPSAPARAARRRRQERQAGRGDREGPGRSRSRRDGRLRRRRPDRRPGGGGVARDRRPGRPRRPRERGARQRPQPRSPHGRAGGGRRGEAARGGAPHGGRRRTGRVAERREVHAPVAPVRRETQDRELPVHDPHPEPGRGGRGWRPVRGGRHPRARRRARSEGRGLGHRFLRHIMRCRALVLVVDLPSDDPAADLATLRDELSAYDPRAGDAPVDRGGDQGRPGRRRAFDGSRARGRMRSPSPRSRARGSTTCWRGWARCRRRRRRPSRSATPFVVLRPGRPRFTVDARGRRLAREGPQRRAVGPGDRPGRRGRRWPRSSGG